MTEEFSTSETWPMECLRCWHVWQEEYLVRHLTDGHGHDVVVWLRAGALVQPPWSGVSCPSCGHSRVTAFPPGSRSRPGAASGLPTPASVAGAVAGSVVGPGAGSVAGHVAEPVVGAGAGAGAQGTAERAAVRERIGTDGSMSARWAGRVRGRVMSGLNRQPVLLCALLGIVFLLVTGFEVAERVVTHH
ncbi:hypothetical protein AB0395_17890 [Streptosporangium sp. NPDC051023]|uniref:hypothetical protein n=1 Tax=Streptosporangium sp. NPDC051023 TaxID=3155410 RepID=UPI00344E9828